MERNLQIRLARRPVGEPSVEDFRIVEEAVPSPGPGEVLLQTQWLSLDPYMRGRMSELRSYVPPVALDAVMVGGTVGKVLASNDPRFAVGDLALGYGGWQRYSVEPADTLQKLDSAMAHPSYALGILGMPGQTAFCALNDIGAPKAGETLVVSAAAGAVGQVAGQLGKVAGCRVIGVAGGAEKCRYVVDELGFDACIDRKSASLDEALAHHCPEGIDIYFDNTAGAILEAVMKRLRLGARIPLVGLIEQYNATQMPKGPNLAPLLVARAKIEGFLVSDHAAHTRTFLNTVGTLLQQGKLAYREDIVEGLEAAPKAFIGLLRGANLGKLLVRTA
ncbi:MAG: NADP-dependent oxidoreductase [Candidatus Eremiobacteraeota bacterium]|uniref:Putative conserved oxidoreductase, Zn-dependent and NAD(P)-binding n=1 Tax=mine drainage metagenome TaxID=410659 RepID=E6PCQ1_9ZZZZ|nr:NADP-dependent oxidoreductase [Candidatus Eremiobacteraeota bacterium]